DLRSPSVADALTGLDLVRAIKGLGGKRQVREALRVLPMPVAEFVGEAFETDGLLGALAARAVRCSAMGPRSAGTTLTLLTDSSGPGGGAPGEAVFARGGNASLSDALVKACLSFGATTRCGTEVAQFLVRAGSVPGVAWS